MPALTRQRCFNHHAREAVARCVSCTSYFCRECVTEHDGRMTCAACLAKAAPEVKKTRFSFAVPFQAVQLVFSLVLITAVFYFVGKTLLYIPANFHENTLWKLNQWQQK